MIEVNSWTRFLLRSCARKLPLAKADTLQTDHRCLLQYGELLTADQSDGNQAASGDEEDEGYQSRRANVESITLFHAALFFAP